MDQPRTDAEFADARRRLLADASVLIDRLLPTLDAGGQRAARDWLTTCRKLMK